MELEHTNLKYARAKHHDSIASNVSSRWWTLLAENDDEANCEEGFHLQSTAYGIRLNATISLLPVTFDLLPYRVGTGMFVIKLLHSISAENVARIVWITSVASTSTSEVSRECLSSPAWSSDRKELIFMCPLDDLM